MYKMHKEPVTLFCILAALFCLTSALRVTECVPGSTANIVSITVTPCASYLNGCKLVRGTNASFSMVIRPNQEITQLNHRVYGLIAGFPMPFGVGGLNACRNVLGGCPLQAEHEFVYTNQFEIRPSYPSIGVTIKYVLLSEEVQVACFLMDSRIV